VCRGTTRRAATTVITRRLPGGVHNRDALRGDRLIVVVSLALVTALAWLYLIYLDRQMAAAMAYDVAMADMGMSMDRAWTAVDIGLMFGMWVVMMVGMMAGSATPVLTMFGTALRGRGARGPWPGVVLFACGYLLVWVAFSAAAVTGQWMLHRTAMLNPAMASASAAFSGIVLLAAGVYQFTPWKSACLTQCRSPLAFLMTHWRDGRVGALRMGTAHGWYCLGCCWAVMCILFVVGVMNLFWIAALSVFVLLEKLGPAGPAVSRGAGALMIVAGVVVLARSM
jgi:predicted metal-binding membrane protein